MKSAGAGDRPALPGGIQKARKVKVGIANNMNGVGISDVVNGIVSGVERLLQGYGMAASLVMGRRITVRLGLCSPRCSCCGLFGWMFRVAVLGKCRSGQNTENQGNPILTKGYHIHVRKGSVEIGGKSTTWNRFKKARKIIFPK